MTNMNQEQNKKARLEAGHNSYAALGINNGNKVKYIC